ncbi:hypothetical protein MTR67_031637 [Solanum verrucosum]|uniref:PGG domain-containing protein n=1 Tax=Solanum verrucosum TaxID=315347 RepID=A0AAF0ZFB2_SOLVR|nr:hypothetical protein MTR67_031637 [Solanum verrucosum]
MAMSAVVETVLSHLFSATSGMMLVVPPQAESEGNDHEDRARRDEKVVENIMKTSQMHLVVATLLMTVTFTAGFTLPEGFESDTNSPNKGMAILLRRTAFRAFVVSDAITFTCSSGAVFAYFAMAANSISAVTELTVIIQLYNMAIALQIYAMAAVVVAFATGMYVTLEHSIGLAITVYFIGSMKLVL